MNIFFCFVEQKGDDNTKWILCELRKTIQFTSIITNIDTADFFETEN